MSLKIKEDIEGETMTVEQLIKELQALNPKLRVEIDDYGSEATSAFESDGVCLIIASQDEDN